MKFNGFEDWIPIFRGGKQTDSNGVEHDGDALIDTAVATFDASKHEPPAVIGHPAENAPAFGWVEALKKQGDLLLAKFKQMQPDFAGMVKQGLFKKRSAAFYPDGSLRHVGFLGAMPPAVKGLPDVAFGDQDVATFEFAAETVTQPIQYNQKKEDKNMTFKEKLTAFFNEFIGKMPDDGPAVVATAPGIKFSEADLETAKKLAAEDAAKKEREKMTAEFAEKDRLARQAARKSEIAAWCGTQVKEGKLTPALVKFGVPEMLDFMASSEDVIEFGETKEKATIFDRFKLLFETELPKIITFKEVATRDKDAGGLGSAGAKIDALIKEKQKVNKELSYSAAFAEVQKENADLATEYRQEISK